MKALPAGWRSSPPTLDEVRAGSSWWWYRQRGEDGYTAPHVLEIGFDDDGLFFVEPDCPRVTPEEYGDGAEWSPFYPPDTATTGPATLDADDRASLQWAHEFIGVHAMPDNAAALRMLALLVRLLADPAAAEQLAPAEQTVRVGPTDTVVIVEALELWDRYLTAPHAEIKRILGALTGKAPS